MGLPPLAPELAKEAFDAWQRFGSKAEAARQLGMPVTTLKSRIDIFQKDPAISAAQEAVGTNMTPQLAWVKTKNEDGTSYSVLLKPDPLSYDKLDAIKEVLSGLPAARPQKLAEDVEQDLLTLYPIADLHAGMMAWGRETGEDYDTSKSMRRLQEWAGKCIARSPKSALGVVLGAGDLLHANDVTNQTPQSKHTLDTDTRQFKTIESLVASLGVVIDQALTHHARILVVIKPGNHDRDAYLAILFALSERYRKEPRVDVDMNPSEFWAFQFGLVMLACHHGDKAKAERMVLYMADEFADMWGQTVFRFLWTGHLHHHKSQDFGGVAWEQLRAMTARDAHAASHAYSARAEMQAITYHREKGEVSRVRVAS